MNSFISATEYNSFTTILDKKNQKPFATCRIKIAIAFGITCCKNTVCHKILMIIIRWWLNFYLVWLSILCSCAVAWVFVLCSASVSHQCTCDALDWTWSLVDTVTVVRDTADTGCPTLGRQSHNTALAYRRHQSADRDTCSPRPRWNTDPYVCLQYTPHTDRSTPFNWWTETDCW